MKAHGRKRMCFDGAVPQNDHYIRKVTNSIFLFAFADTLQQKRNGGLTLQDGIMRRSIICYIYTADHNLTPCQL